MVANTQTEQEDAIVCGLCNKAKCQPCLFNIRRTGILLVCFWPACILLACVGFGQEIRANAPSPTSNGCQAPLNVMGWLESWRRGGQRWSGEKLELTGPKKKKKKKKKKREIQPHRAGLRAYQSFARCSFAEAAKANQMQRRLLCATTCQVQPQSTWGALEV